MSTKKYYLDFNVRGKDRKRLVETLAELLEEKAKYLGAPTFAYEVGYFTIDKEGCAYFDDADVDEISWLNESLIERGFFACVSNFNMEDEDENNQQEESVGLTITIPLNNVKVGNLTNLLDTKGELVKKALGIENTKIEVTENDIKFPWFSELPTADETKAYTKFITALCDMSVKQKRINTTARKDIDNEKYAFRCFLLRLGFIGDEYKAERKILLKKLSGSSAFKSGSKKEELTTNA